MVRKAVRSVGALLTLVLLETFAVPGLGNVSGPDDPGDDSSGSGAGADRLQVARASLKASAATCLVQGTVEQAMELHGLEPATLDEATLQQLIDDAWPDAVEQAELWVSTLDPSAFEAVHPSPAYCSGLGCPGKVRCESKHYKKTITCELQACGDARCKPCPDWFGPLKNLVIKAWCSYVCKDGETVVGSSAYVITAWDPYQLCMVP